MLIKKIPIACLLMLFVFTFATPAAGPAKTSEYKSIVRHLKTKYCEEGEDPVDVARTFRS
jgi:hypothetical protein